MRQHCHLLLRFYHFWYRPANLVKYPQVKTLQMTWERFTWKWRHQRVWSRFDHGVLSILWTQTTYVVCVKRKLGPAPSAPRASGRCVSTWTFSLVVLTISVFLLVGLFLGYYIHDGQSYTDKTPCDYTVRTDGFDADRLEMVHENVMYLMSGLRITDTAGYVNCLAN